MNIDSNKKIVSFSSTAGSSDPATCEICGALRLTASFCQGCALRLIDLGLADFPDIVSQEAEPLPETVGHLPRAIRRYYDHYEICQTLDRQPWELGRGAMGITYKAVDMNLGCPVALKIINARSLAGTGARERLLKEARTAAQLRHLNIASIFHLGLDDENCYYSMEYIEGETLEAYVRRVGKLPTQTALEIVLQVARALRVAHKQQFVHRDIKPSNIMVVQGDSAADIVVKVIDFGLVKALSEEGLTGEWNVDGYFAGTPFYASPEQLENGNADARSDIYSLGRCLCYMLTGQPPTQNVPSPVGRNPVHKSKVLLESIHQQLPATVVALLRSMLAVDPAQRPQRAIDLVQKVQACRAALEHRPGRLRRVLLLGGWAIFAIAILGAIGLYPKFARFRGVPRSSENSIITADARHLYAQADDFYYQQSKAGNQRALELYSAAIAQSPGFADAHAALACVYFQEYGRYDAPISRLDLAVASAQRAIAIDPRRPRGFVALGIIRTLQGRHWEALSQLRQALEVAPQNYTAMCNFSLCWSLVGRPEMGLPWAVAATRIEPSKTDALIAGADACVDLCADDQAEKFYRRCLELKPGSMPAHCGLSHLWLLQGDFLQATQNCNIAESIQPGIALISTLKAQIELFSGDYPAAEASYRSLLAINRRGRVEFYSGISYLSALAYLRQLAGDIEESRALLSEAATLHLDAPEGPQSIYDLAAIRAIEGKTTEALALLQQAITSGWMDYRATLLDPRFSSVRENPIFQTMIGALKNHVAQRRHVSEQLCAKAINLADYPVQPSR